MSPNPISSMETNRYGWATLVMYFEHFHHSLKVLQMVYDKEEAHLSRTEWEGLFQLQKLVGSFASLTPISLLSLV